MKIGQLLFNAAMGIQPTDEEFNALYLENREIIALIESRPKEAYTLSKPGKANRTVMARCIAEIEANPANKGWDIAPQSASAVQSLCGKLAE